MQRVGSTITTRRSAARQDEIAAAAARLFYEQGYHRVRMGDVAAEVGITGGAIYRHFANKADLLDRVINDVLDAFGACVDPDLETTLSRLGALFAARREVGVLLQREAPHLSGAAGAAAQRRAAAVNEHVARRLRVARPIVGADDATFLTRSVSAALCSVGYHTAAPLSADLLAGIAVTVLGCRGPGDAEAIDGEPAAPARASRREALLAAAVDLFGARGYTAVRMEDVGAVAGISGPSIYEHFASKADLLVTALTRAADFLQLEMTRALAETTGPQEQLQGVVRAYVECAFRQPALTGLLLREAVYLPADDWHALRRVQHAYVEEWIHLLHTVRPGIDHAEARVRTHAVIGIINEHTRDRRVQDKANRVDVLVDLGMQVLVTEAMS